MSGPHGNSKELARVATVRHRIFTSPKKILEENLEIRAGGFAGRVAIRGHHAIIDEDFDLLTVKAKLSPQAGVRLQTLAGCESSASRLFQAVLIVAIETRLPIGSNNQTVICVVHAVVAFVADQDHSGAGVDMP